MNFIRKITIFAAIICVFSISGCSDYEDSYWDELLSYTGKLTTPTPVFDSDASTASKLVLTWDGDKYAYTYVVRFWKEGETATELLSLSNSCTFTDLTPETTYYAQVQARIYKNIEECNSDFSAVVSGTTSPMPEEGDINIKLINASSSTLTLEWDLYGSASTAAENDYNIALYCDEACTDLWVSWLLAGDYGHALFTQNGYTYVRFTFSGLDPGTEYWAKITLADDNLVFSNPFSATTETFPSASTNTTAEVGDILIAQDFSGVVHGGDMAFKALGVTDSDRSTYEIPKGINPTNLATPVHWDTEYNIFNGTNVSTAYTTGAGLGDWCMGTGTNTSTRPGYLKIGGSSGALGYLATPELTAIPDGKTATVQVDLSIMCYVLSEGSYGGDVQVGVVNNVEVGSQNQAAGWTTTSDSAVLEDSVIIDVSGSTSDFLPYTVTLTNVTNKSRIRICSYKDDPESLLTRFLLNDVLITVTDLK